MKGHMVDDWANFVKLRLGQTLTTVQALYSVFYEIWSHHKTIFFGTLCETRCSNIGKNSAIRTCLDNSMGVMNWISLSFKILAYCVKIRSDGCHCSQWSFQKEKRQKISTESGKKMKCSFHGTHHDVFRMGLPPF